MTPRILVVDDQFAHNATERYQFKKNAGLAEAGKSIAGAKPLAEAVFCSGQREEENLLINDYTVVQKAVRRGEWALVLLDVQFDSGELDAEGRPKGQMGDDSFGGAIRRRLKEDFPNLPVVMLTSKGQLEIQEDGTPYLSKHQLGPCELRRALLQYGNIDAVASREALGLREEIAYDPATLAAYRDAFIHAGSDVSVLILGESGVGKEFLARYIHRTAGRKGPLVAVNVAAIAKGLVESELFGVGKRVATEVDARPGKFEQASGGTLFLDEIGDMPLDVQAKVLRALQERKITRVGEAKEVPVDIRLICATSRNLASLIESGQFRADLFYRINTVSITMPPLRERKADIAPLARGFLEEFATKQGKVGLSFSSEALRELETQPFPGNVRELGNLVERLSSAAGHHRFLGRGEILEVIVPPAMPSSPREHPPVPTAAIRTASGLHDCQSLDDLLALLDNFVVSADPTALKGAKPRVDAVHQRLLQRLAGAALERCRDPNNHSLKLQPAMRLLTGDGALKGKGPARIINEILGKLQEHAVGEEDLEKLVEMWREGEQARKGK